METAGEQRQRRQRARAKSAEARLALEVQALRLAHSIECAKLKADLKDKNAEVAKLQLLLELTAAKSQQGFEDKLKEERCRWEEEQRQARAKIQQSLADEYGLKLPQDAQHGANQRFSYFTSIGNAGDYEAAQRYRAFAWGTWGFVLLPLQRL